MKILKSICAASLLSLAIISVTSCGSSDEEKEEITTTKSVKIRVTTEPLARMGYTDQDNTILTQWTVNDAFRILPSNGNESQVFTLTEGAGTTIGTFEGTNPQIGEGTYTVFYPSNLKSTTGFDIFSFTDQLQDGNSNTAGIAAFHTVKLVSTTPDYTAISFAHAVQSSVVVMSFNNLPGSIGVPTQITLTADDACWATTNSEMAKEISLKLVNMTAAPTMKAYMALGANPNNEKLTAKKKLTVKVTGNAGVCDHTFTIDSDIVFAGGKCHKINISNWNTDGKPTDSDVIVNVPSFGDGVILDDSNSGESNSVNGNTPELGDGANIQQ